MVELRAPGGGAETSAPGEECRRCGGPNVIWHAPSPLWNAVMRGGCINGPTEFSDLVCPTCFVVLAEQRGVASGWRLDAREVNVELQTVTPSGRVWDAEQDLWVEPELEAASENRVGPPAGNGEEAGPVQRTHSDAASSLPEIPDFTNGVPAGDYVKELWD